MDWGAIEETARRRAGELRLASIDLARKGSRVASAAAADIGRRQRDMTGEQRARLRNYAIAIGTVAGVVAFKLALGADSSAAAHFLLFDAAVAVTAFYGGLWPAVVAALASILAADLISEPAAVPALAWVMFAAGALAVAVLAGLASERWRSTAGRLDAAERQNDELSRELRHARVSIDAFRLMETVAPEAAALAVNRSGVITQWHDNAERLFGYPADEIIGTTVDTLAYGQAPEAMKDLLAQALTSGSAQATVITSRRDGTRFDAEVAAKRSRDAGPDGLVIAVRDLTGELEMQDFRRSAARAQSMQDAEADRMRAQLATIESITDPSLSPLNIREHIDELLERARLAVEADGLAVVFATRNQPRLAAASGVQPYASASRAQVGTRQYQTGRVAIVHNDPARVAQASTLVWPDTVGSLMLVPVMSGGRLHSVIEVVNERPRRSTDWDLALIRIVADRISTIDVGDDYGHKGAVA